MKTPIFLLSQILLIVFAGSPQTGISQWIVPVPCAVPSATFFSLHEALHHDLTPARELFAKCNALRGELDRAHMRLQAGASHADRVLVQQRLLKLKKMEAHIAAMREDLSRTYPRLRDPRLATETLLLASPTELAALLHMEVAGVGEWAIQ
jgi:hypothetical protein